MAGVPAQLGKGRAGDWEERCAKQTGELRYPEAGSGGWEEAEGSEGRGQRLLLDARQPLMGKTSTDQSTENTGMRCCDVKRVPSRAEGRE